MAGAVLELVVVVAVAPPAVVVVVVVVVVEKRRLKADGRNSWYRKSVNTATLVVTKATRIGKGDTAVVRRPSAVWRS